MTFIIGAAIALIILVVIIVIFSSKMNIFGGKSNEVSGTVGTEAGTCKVPGVKWCVDIGKCTGTTSGESCPSGQQCCNY